VARVVAVDPGTRRIGLAVSDPGGVIAQPVGMLPARPAATLVERLAARARELGASELVVGLPRRMDGALGPEAKAAQELAGRLRERTGLRVTMVDERLTSVAAERALIEGGERRARRREKSDQVAAALILQGYLGRRKSGLDR
jgi:putative Holliday junction resolvase